MALLHQDLKASSMAAVDLLEEVPMTFSSNQHGESLAKPQDHLCAKGGPCLKCFSGLISTPNCFNFVLKKPISAGYTSVSQTFSQVLPGCWQDFPRGNLRPASPGPTENVPKRCREPTEIWYCLGTTGEISAST